MSLIRFVPQDQVFLFLIFMCDNIVEMIKERKKRLEEEIERLMAEDLPDENQSDEEETKEKTEKENMENPKQRNQSGLRDRGNDGQPRRGSESSKRESPRKGWDNNEGRRKSHEGESRRRDSYEGERKRRKSSAERHESKYRRKSDGEGGRDRHSKRDSHRSKRDDMPREVKINYDDPEIEETEEVINKGESEVKFPEVKVTDLADIQLPETRTESDERKLIMPEDAEDGEEGPSMDAVDE